MAYRRTARSSYRARGRAAPARRRAPARRAARTSTRRSTGRGSTNTIRIVMETAPMSAVSRSPFAPVIEAKNGGKAKL